MGGGRGASTRDPFPLALGLVALGGLVGRMLFVYLSRAWVLKGDGFAYRIEADRLLDGHVQGPLHPPAWTFVVAIPPALGFHGRIHQQAFTALVGVAAVVVVGLAGRYVFGRRVGLIAAALMAVYPNAWLYEREVLSEPLTMLVVAAAIWAVYRFRDGPSLLGAVGLGALLGVMALVRSELIFASVAVVMPAILSRTQVPLPRRVGWLALAGVTSLAAIAPWAVFNSTRYERPLPLSSGLGPAMASGNCPPTYSGELTGYYNFGCVVVVLDRTSEDPSVSDPQLRDRALTFMRADPGRSVEVALIRVGRTFNVYRPFQQARLETERGSALWLTRSALVAYWILAPLAVAGAVLTRRRKIALYPLLAYPLIVVLAVLPTIGAVRYRASAEVPIVLLAAVTLDHLARRWAPRRDAGPVDAPELEAEPQPEPELQPEPEPAVS